MVFFCFESWFVARIRTCVFGVQIMGHAERRFLSNIWQGQPFHASLCLFSNEDRYINATSVLRFFSFLQFFFHSLVGVNLPLKKEVLPTISPILGKKWKFQLTTAHGARRTLTKCYNLQKFNNVSQENETGYLSFHYAPRYQCHAGKIEEEINCSSRTELEILPRTRDTQKEEIAKISADTKSLCLSELIFNFFGIALSGSLIPVFQDLAMQARPSLIGADGSSYRSQMTLTGVGVGFTPSDLLGPNDPLNFPVSFTPRHSMVCRGYFWPNDIIYLVHFWGQSAGECNSKRPTQSTDTGTKCQLVSHVRMIHWFSVRKRDSIANGVSLVFIQATFKDLFLQALLECTVFIFAQYYSPAVNIPLQLQFLPLLFLQAGM